MCKSAVCCSQSSHSQHSISFASRLPIVRKIIALVVFHPCICDAVGQLVYSVFIHATREELELLLCKNARTQFFIFLTGRHWQIQEQKQCVLVYF